MKFPAFLKRKSTYIVLAILIGGGIWISHSRSSSKNPTFETEAVTRGDLRQTVEVTGELKPASRIDLAFKSGGTLGKVHVKIGDAVKAGDVLAQLKADDVGFAMKQAAASLSVARANLNQRIAGSTAQSIKVAETQVEQAQASYDKAVADLDSTKKTTQDNLTSATIALQTAKNNLDNQGAIVTQNVQNAYDTARTQLLTAVGPLNSALTDGDQITGVDNTAANQNYVNLLGFLNAGSLDRAKAAYSIAKTSKIAAETALNALTPNSSPKDIETAASSLKSAITLVQMYLTDVQAVLAATITSSNFTTTDLSAKKSTIDADRTSVSAQSSAVLSALQAIAGSELTKTQTAQQLQDAYQAAQTSYQTALTNADVQVRSAQTTVNIQKAALDAAKAALDEKKSGPRDVDLAPLRAALEQAQVAYDQAVNNLRNVEVIAPVDGTISDVGPSLGELVSPNATVVSMVGTQNYDVEANVPEADITKIKTGQTAQITLDAYGDEVKFTGTVSAKDPSETRIQEAIYYKIHIQIDPAGREVKPGMTANVTVTTGLSQSALIIPLRAIRTSDKGEKTVRVLAHDQPESRTIEIGLKGDEGRVEVTKGVSEGERVIVGS